MQRLQAILILLGVWTLFVVPTAAAEDIIAKIESCEGSVELQKHGETSFRQVRSGEGLEPNDTLRTGSEAKAAIAFVDGSFLRLAENTLVNFQPQRVELPEGKIYYFSRTPKEVPNFDTPSVMTAIRGTEFGLEVSATQTKASVLDGAIEMTNAQGRVVVASGEQGTAKMGEAPVKGILVKPLDAVQWALFFPPSITGETPELKKLAALIAAGDVQKAQAESLTLEHAAMSADVRAASIAQRAIVALGMNQKEEARSLVSEAYALAPESPAVLLAHSFVAQSFMNLDDARAWAEKLLAADPSNPHAAARLAEIELGTGYDRDALARAKTAAEAAPEDSYVQAIYGYAALMRGETDTAREVFELAAAKHGEDPMVQFGLGLTLIHQGSLDEGRRRIEQAAFLAPQVSLYRSYLGKAFFEEEREREAGHEYDRAISLDPLDPTPYLYRAYNELSQNDPVSALDDVEKSIALNDNRAVYRSRMLLDKDEGVRSASLSETFTSLGFSRAAQVEAIKSISRDYSNYSAHLLLADSYNSILLGDARLSERSIVELLAPLSFNLFENRAGEAGINEYNALFERPQSRTNIGGTFSSYDDLIAPIVSEAGRTEHAAGTISANSVITKGSKRGNYARFYEVNGLGSYEFNPDTRVIGGSNVRYDRYKDFDSDPENQRVVDFDSTLGFHQRLDVNSTLIGALTYRRLHGPSFNHGIIQGVTLEEIEDGETSSRPYHLETDDFWRRGVETFKGDIQHIFDSEIISIVSGFEGNATNTRRNEDSPVVSDPEDLFSGSYNLRSNETNSLRSTNSYLYGILHLARWADLTVGGAFTHVEIEKSEFSPFIPSTRDLDRLNPKVGMALYPLNDLTLRAAYFETLRKSDLQDTVTLEPTLVGGINQLFSDFSGTRARTIAAGADLKLPGSAYIGLEGALRHAVRPMYYPERTLTINWDEETIASSEAFVSDLNLHKNERFANAYYSQVWTDRLVSTIGYDFVKLDSRSPGLPQRMDLHKVTGEIRYFDSSGLFPYFSAAWREPSLHVDEPEDGRHGFLVVNAGLGYRIPKRHGSVVFEVSNMLDRDFTYDQSFGVEPYVHPGIGFTLGANFNF